MPESSTFAPYEGIRNLKTFAYRVGILTLESGIQLKESGIVNKESRTLYLESGIHGLEFRIQYCLGFSYMEGFEFPGRYFLITGLWGCAAGWGRIFIRVTRMGSHIFGFWG